MQPLTGIYITFVETIKHSRAIVIAVLVYVTSNCINNTRWLQSRWWDTTNWSQRAWWLKMNVRQTNCHFLLAKFTYPCSFSKNKLNMRHETCCVVNFRNNDRTVIINSINFHKLGENKTNISSNCFAFKYFSLANCPLLGLPLYCSSLVFENLFLWLK